MRRGNVQTRTEESVPIFNKTELSMDRIVEDVMRITYVYVATVDGRILVPPTEELWSPPLRRASPLVRGVSVL